MTNFPDEMSTVVLISTETSLKKYYKKERQSQINEI